MVTPFPEAVQHALKDQQDKTWSTQWGKSLIVIIWGYSAALWKHRNAHIYGVDDADAKRNTNLQLQARVQEACTAYEVDRFYVSPQHLSLIQSRSIMEERLWHGNEYMEAWLTTVQEAHCRQKIFRDTQTKITQYFLSPIDREPATAGCAMSASPALFNPGWLFLHICLLLKPYTALFQDHSSFGMNAPLSHPTRSPSWKKT